MKNLITSAAIILLTLVGNLSLAATSVPDTIRIRTSGELSPMVTQWIKGYSTITPGALFTVRSEEGAVANGREVITFTGEESLTREKEAGLWKITVAHNAVVALINTKNPVINEIRTKGITAAGISKILEGSGIITWSDLFPGAPSKPLTLFVTDASSQGKNLAEFTHSETAILKDHEVSKGNLVKSVASDIYSIGFCSLNDIGSGRLNNVPEGTELVPIDRNANGRIDSFEKIYDNPETLLRGVWTGKYPHALCGSIYAASAVRPSDNETMDFLKWIVAEGDKSVSSAGFSQLTSTEKESVLASIAGVSASTGKPSAKNNNPWAILLIVVVVTAAVLVAVIRSLKKRAPAPSKISDNTVRVLNEKILTAPAGLYFDKSHTWAYMERDGLVRIGIDDFLQHITGTVTDIKMIEPGEYVRRGEKIITVVKDGKQLSLYAPVSGYIRSQNTDLYVDSSLINSSPYSDGWLYLLEPKNWTKEIQMLFSVDRFREWITAEFTRLRDFLAESLMSHYPEFAPVVLQDGGELSDNPLEKLGPEVWEDFQTNFIDKSR